MGGACVSVELESLVVTGLDSFTSFEPLLAISDYTVRSTIAMAGVGVEVGLRVNLTDSDGVTRSETNVLSTAGAMRCPVTPSARSLAHGRCVRH